MHFHNLPKNGKGCFTGFIDIQGYDSQSQKFTNALIGIGPTDAGTERERREGKLKQEITKRPPANFYSK